MIHMDITPDLEEDSRNRPIELDIDIDNRHRIRLMFDPDDIAATVHSLIDKGMQAAISNKKDVKSLMMKSSLNAALIGFGPFLIDMFWCGDPADKPKPGRKDDLVEWYARFIVEQLLTFIKTTEYKLSLIGRTIGIHDDTTATVKIDSIRTKSIS
jgi:hypothetical protein